MNKLPQVITTPPAGGTNVNNQSEWAEGRTNQEYEEFIEKFKPKLTTDDCYTPPIVYDTILDWARQEYHLDKDTMIVRPFFPGGDFEHYEYPNGCVVVDNPPFSMMAHILDYYQEHHIRFFLFCDTRRQGTTALKRDGLTFICTNAKVVYENGAVVNTSFITNMTPDVVIRTAPVLKKKIESLSCGQSKPKRRLQHHPNTLTFARLARIATIDYQLRRHDLALYDKCSRVFKALYGAYGLLSDKKAAEVKAAEVKAVVELAEEDYKLIEQLNNRDNHEHKDMSTY